METSTTRLGAVLRTAEARLRVRWRLQLAGLLLGSTAACAAAGVLLHRLGSAAPTASALLTLALVLGLVGTGLALGRQWLAWEGGAQATARLLDQRAGLREELNSALWLGRQTSPSEWVEAQALRAGETAARLDLARLLPVWPTPARLSGVLGGVLLAAGMAAWPLPRGVGPPAAASPGLASLPSPLARISDRLVRELPGPVAEQLRQELAQLDQSAATPVQKQAALAAAREAIAQEQLRVAALRARLLEEAGRLDASLPLGAVATALREGDAGSAVGQLRELSAGPASAPADNPSETAAHARSALRRLSAGGLLDAAGGISDAAARLQRVAWELDQIERMNRVGVAPEQGAAAGQAGVSQAEARVGETSGSGEALQREGSRSTGGAPRDREAVAQPRASTGTQGGRAGNPVGAAPAEPALGAAATPLEVTLRREAIARGSDGQDPAPDWFYRASRQQQSQLARTGDAGLAHYAQAGDTGPEPIALRHRRLVREYFSRQP